MPLPPGKAGAAPAPGVPSPLPGKDAPAGKSSPSRAQPEEKAEYSTREVKPAVLLLQDLLRAHSVFLLHHAGSLAALFARTQRAEFVALLGQYWDLFLSTWNVLLHGNPACNVLGGIKIAASGELGMGVGEEDRGSGERAVLEGLVGRVDGLVDLVVGRFGEQVVPSGDGKGPASQGSLEAGRWLGAGNEPGAEDGAVFLGVGAVSRQSLRAITYWMEDVYTWGNYAYGVHGGLGASRSQQKRRKGSGKKAGTETSAGEDKQDQGKRKSKIAEPPSEGDVQSGGPADEGGSVAAVNPTAETGGESGMDKIFSYLKLGYGTSWSLGTSSPSGQSNTDDEPTAKPSAAEDASSSKFPKELGTGRFLIGLADEANEPDQSEPPGPANPRAVTVTVELAGPPEFTIPEDPPSEEKELAARESQNHNTTEDLRPAIYINSPFICVLLFRPSSSADWATLSHTLLTHLTPLHKPLLTSTAYRPEKPSLGPQSPSTAQIYDLIFDPDPSSLTIHATIPNIPDPVLMINTLNPAGTATTRQQQQQQPQQERQPAWTRVEALNTHAQILNLFASTRECPGKQQQQQQQQAVERTCKTSRGWWVVWSRVGERRPSMASLPPSSSSSSSFSSSARRAPSGSGSSLGGIKEEEADGEEAGQEEEHNGGGGSTTPRVGDGAVAAGKEIFLIRRASDHGGGGGGRSVSSSYAGGVAGSLGTGGVGWAMDFGASRLAQGVGIGVDTRRYIEGLLSLNR